MKMVSHVERLEEMLLRAIKTNDKEAIRNIKMEIARLKLAQ